MSERVKAVELHPVGFVIEARRPLKARWERSPG